MRVIPSEDAIVTHDSGSPRDQLLPMYVAKKPRGYMGWGKSHQLGTGLGLAIGAKVGAPDKMCVNFMGDAAFGMTGLDFESAVRCGIPITTIVLNNSTMAIETHAMKASHEKHRTRDLGGNYAAIGKDLGGWSERVDDPGGSRPRDPARPQSQRKRRSRAPRIHHQRRDRVLPPPRRRLIPHRGRPMRRRDLIASIAAMAAAWPRVLHAQQKAMPVIGVLGATTAASYASRIVAFREGLGETGYVEGQNVMIEYRWAEGHYDRLPVLAADLVGRKVDVIAAFTPPSALAMKAATSTIPIVFSVGIDPVAAGLVASLARPGGNLTGVSILFTELVPKLLELISELVSQTEVIALLVNSNSPEAEPTIRGAQEAARAKRVTLHVLKAASENEIDAAFATLVQRRAGALVIGADPFFEGRREQIVASAARDAIPTIYFRPEFAAAGGLIGYGPSLTGAFRQAGIYAGRILKGEKPADLPVQQPTKFELVINLKTAKALGLAVPQSLLARADEVIE